MDLLILDLQKQERLMVKPDNSLSLFPEMHTGTNLERTERRLKTVGAQNRP